MDIKFKKADQISIEHMIADPDFRRLQSFNQNANTFLINEVNELKHSRMIRWILDPQEAHGLGVMPLIGLLNFCWNEVKDLPKDRQPIFFSKHKNSPLSISQKNFGNSKIFVEHSTDKHGRIDLLIVCPDESLAIIIENKYGAGETKDQLKKYRKWGDKYLSKYDVLYLYMDGTEQWKGAPDKEWIKISYDWLLDLFVTARIIDNVSSRISQIFNDYYALLTEDYLLSDAHYDGITEISRRFISKHARALSIINDSGVRQLTYAEYLSKIQEKWTTELRLICFYHQNEDVFELLLDWDKNEELANYLSKSNPKWNVECSNKYINVHHESWRTLMQEDAVKWAIHLYFKENENPDKKAKRSFSLRLRYFYKGFDVSSKNIKIINNVWNELCKKGFNIVNAKSRSLLLEKEISADKDEMIKLTSEYVKRINKHFGT